MNMPQQGLFKPQPQTQSQQFYNPLQPNFLNDPVASMAVKYGSNLADQGKEYVAQNVNLIISIKKKNQQINNLKNTKIK
jgi:hypothetical protein